MQFLINWFLKTALLPGAVFLFLCSQCLAAIVMDDAGNRIELSQPARRLVVLAPDLVENVFAIGAGDNIVGLIQGSDFPRQARKLNKVGSYAGIDLERIVALQPDLIIAWKYAFSRQVAALKRLGIPVYISAPRKLSDVPRLLVNLGKLTGREKRAGQAAMQYQSALQQLKTRYSKKEKVNVFYLIDNHSLITVNKDSWINSVIELCGGNNIFAELHSVAPQVSRESIIARNPQVIMNNAVNDNWKQSWTEWKQISAVNHAYLFTVNPDLIARAGPRLVQGASQVCRYLDLLRT